MRRPPRGIAENVPGGRGLIETIDSQLRIGTIVLPFYSNIGREFRQIAKSEFSVEDLTEILRMDGAIATRIAKRAKSVPQWKSRPVRTLEDVVEILGVDVTRRMIEVFMHQGLFIPRNERYRRRFDAVWRHVIICAHVAELLAQREGDPGKSDAFALGLLHDIGALGLLQCAMELEYQRWVKAAQIDRELATVIAKHHGSFGSLLLKRWAFSREFLEIATAHEQVDASLSSSRPLVLVRVANDLANWIEPYERSVGRDELVANSAVKSLGITNETPDAFRAAILASLALIDFQLGNGTEW